MTDKGRKRDAMLKIGQLTLIIYAIALFAGGVDGLIEKGSVISLIASVVFMGLFFIALRVMRTNPKFGLGLGSLFVILSFGRFASVFGRKHEMWPAGFYTIAGSIAALIIGVAFLMEKENADRPGSEYPV